MERNNHAIERILRADYKKTTGQLTEGGRRG